MKNIKRVRRLRRRRVGWWYPPLAVVVVIVVGLRVFNSLKIREVGVVWDEPTFASPAAEERVKNYYWGRNLLRVGPGAPNLMLNFPQLVKVRLSRHYPRRLTVSLTTRRPILKYYEKEVRADAAGLFYDHSATIGEATASALLKGKLEELSHIPPGSPVFLADGEGNVFWQSITDNFPVTKVILFGRPTLKVGQKLPTRPAKLSLDYYLAARANSYLSQINYEYLASTADPWLLAKVAGGPVIVLPPEADYSRIVSSLQFILSKYSLEGKYLKRVDLRFKYPVVEY